MKIKKVKKILLSYCNDNDDEDLKRRKLLLNVLCLSIISFLVLLIILSLYSTLTENTDNSGIIILILFIYLVLTISALILGRKNKVRAGSLIIIISMYACILYGSCIFGIDLPTVLLAIFIMVLTTGILIDSKSGLIASVFLSFHLFIFNYVERHNLMNINNTWKFGGVEVDDIIEYSSILIFAAAISWLNNIQLHKTLDRSRKAEDDLRQERNTLDTKVQEKTEEIRMMQIEKISSMYRMVEFGRISSGLFHDIINPLTNISLNIHNLKTTSVEENLKYLIPSVKRIDQLIQQAKQQIKIDYKIETIYVQEETRNILELLKSKAMKLNVRLILSKDANNKHLSGSKTLFSHIITNLISNAIDSYNKSLNTARNKIVIISTKQTTDILFIKIKDNGCGIPKEILANIFEPFYTTKEEHSCGIGLSSTKHILEKYFNGKIMVKSEPNKGSTFTISIPNKI